MQRRFSIVLLRYYIFLMAMCAISLEMSARLLSPDEALTAISEKGNKNLAGIGKNPLRLSHTVCGDVSGQPAIYIFSNAGSDGFCILAADDAVGDILFGYSDTSTFDPLDIPPGMQWLLDRYAALVSMRRINAARHGDYTPVSPLVSTKWAQEAPYNNMCPVMSGYRAPVGCVAIAMAQVMKMHCWPVTANGSCLYSYTAGGEDFTMSVDLSGHEYRWADMLDSYVETSTAEQRDAVALLASDCGVASHTEYSAISAATSLNAGKGMIEHFGYDRSLKYLNREWFTYAEWEKLIYEQLIQGRPVIYSGNEDPIGHTFLIDGADGEGFFHFNWGWYGVSDGYYSLADLSPVDPGDNQHIYNTEQNMLMDIMPDAGSGSTGSMAVTGRLSTNKSVYNSDTDYINFLGGFYSFALEELPYSIGFVAETDPPKYITVLDGMLDTTWGYPNIAVFSGAFPDGEYDVYPVFKIRGGEWHKMYFNRNLTSGYLHFVNEGRTITVSGGDVANSKNGNVVSATFVGTVPHDGLETRLFPGKEYDFLFDVAADGECVEELRCLLIDENGEMVEGSVPVVMDFLSAGETRIAFPMTLADTIEPGSYRVECKVRKNGADWVVPDVAWVEVFQESISLNETSLHIYIGEEYELKATTHSELIPVVWTSSDESVASVDSCGMVTALSEGSATVTAVCGGVSAECVVTVSPVLPESIKVTPTYILVEVGKSIVLEVNIYPENTTDKTVTWTCSNPDIVIVGSDGTLTAQSNGYAEITASCGEVSTTCYVSAFSGIDDVEPDKVAVTAENGALHVSSPGNIRISVYSMDGTLFYDGFSHNISLAPGRYIVIIGDKVFKIVVES